MKLSFSHLGISVESSLIVAVSGGADSVALLQALIQAGFKRIVVAHVDHQLREESGEEARFVEGVAKSYELPFELKRVEVRKLAEEGKENLEAVGRSERYAFFEELRTKHDADCIVTAHHADDQLETVLLNMVRGCGLDGLSGMRGLEGHLWRPLLGVSKQELLNYCEAEGLKYVEDSSNQDLEYRRNFLRHQVVPQLKELNSNLLGTMQDNIQLWQQTNDFLLSEAKTLLAELEVGSLRYDLSKFLKLKDFMQALVLRELFQQVHGHRNNLGQDHLDQLLKVLRTNASGKQKEFGSGRILFRSREWFEIR